MFEYDANPDKYNSTMCADCSTRSWDVSYGIAEIGRINMRKMLETDRKKRGL